MKKILLLVFIATIGLAGTVSAQQRITKIPNIKFNNIHQSVSKPELKRDEVSLFINYYIYDFLFDSTNYVANQGWRMNSNFVMEDTTGGDYGLIKYFVVAYDTFFDYDQFITYDKSEINTIKVDSIFIRAGWEQNSVNDDTMKITIVKLNASGYPTGTVLWDTLLIHGLGSTFDNQYNWLTTVAVGTPLLTSEKKFGVKVEYFAPKEDTFAFVAGFPKFGAPCLTLTNPPKEDELYPSNSFSFWVRFGALMGPHDVYFDCNNDNQYTASADAANPLQDINVGVIVTLDLFTGVERINPDVKNAYIYPNPATTSTTLYYTMNNSVVNSVVKVYDLTGKEVESINLGNVSGGAHQLELNTSNYVSGVYMYSITSDNGKTYGKFIKR